MKMCPDLVNVVFSLTTARRNEKESRQRYYEMVCLLSGVIYTTLASSSIHLSSRGSYLQALNKIEVCLTEARAAFNQPRRMLRTWDDNVYDLPDYEALLKRSQV
jgi:hypothetical protein